jgi:putative inorganic carbon (hco3(-)) transporter
MIYITIYSLFHKGTGSGNYFKDENDLCLYINSIIPFCYFLFLCEKNKKKKLFYAGGLVIATLGIVKSFSRGGFIGFISIVAIAWWFSSKKIVGIIILCLLVSLMFYYGGDTYREEIATVTDGQSGTGRERIESWKSGWEMFLSNPFGVGGNNYQILFPDYQTKYFERGMWGRVAHSLWFTLLPELGIPGIFIYFSLLYYNLQDIFYLKKFLSMSNTNQDIQFLYNLSLAFLASFAGYFASATFLSVLYYPHYWYLTALLVAAKKTGTNFALRNQKLIII